MLRRISIWIGFVLSVAIAVATARARQDWSSQKYEAMVPISMYPMTLGVYIAGVRSGNRDRSHRRPPLADEAPLDGDARAWARLASMVVPLAMVALLCSVVGVTSRIEGGYQLGRGPTWTESAVHSAFELAQPVLSTAVVGAAAISIGRMVRLSGPAVIVGMVLLFFQGTFYWLWNDDVVYATALSQVQPLGFGTVEAVHAPTVVLHDLYLVGVVAVFCGLSLRARPRARLVVGGIAAAAAAVVAQIVVYPW